MRRLSALLGSLALALGVLLVGTPSAAAAPVAMSKCTTASNAVLAVNFGHWGGPIVRACGSTPTTGYTLLNQGGFATQGTKHDGEAFICRIASSAYGGTAYPTPQQDACVNTPPASAYWSYWHADRGQNTWTYSQLGAMSYKPKPGSVDYWQFGGTNIAGTKGRPTVTPDQVRARNASSAGGGVARGGATRAGGGANGDRPVAPRGGNGGANDGDTSGGGERAGGSHGDGRHASSGAGTSGTASASTSGTGSGSKTASSSAGSSGSSGSSQPTSGSAAASDSSAPQIVDADPASAEPKQSDSGSALPVILVIGLVVLLGAGAGVTALRRRRAG